MDDELKQQILNEEHLRLLRIGYFVNAAITGLSSFFILLYTFFLFFIFSQIPKQADFPPPAIFQRIFGVIGVGLASFVFAIAVLQVLTGLRLEQRRSRVLCMITAGITCLYIPFGTLLGVWTFIVLSRSSVQKLFDTPK